MHEPGLNLISSSFVILLLELRPFNASRVNLEPWRRAQLQVGRLRQSIAVTRNNARSTVMRIVMVIMVMPRMLPLKIGRLDGINAAGQVQSVVLTKRWPPSCFTLQNTHSQSVVPIILPNKIIRWQQAYSAYARSHRAASGPMRARGA